MTQNLKTTRRALLSGGAAVLGMPWVRRGALAGPGIPDAAWNELDKAITGGVQRPGDPRFTMLTVPENLRYYNPPATPANDPDPDAPFGVVRPANAKEVATALGWAKTWGVPLVARSGGHSYTAGCTIPGLVIHSGAMTKVQVRDGLLEVGGGALNGHIFDAMSRQLVGGGPGTLTITHGRCRGVGASAFFMGGGIGLNMREQGAGCDLVDSVDLVLADGTPVTASARPGDPNQDLFWAVCGGGGGNLAYATKWRLRPVRYNKVIVFNAIWESRTETKNVFRRLVDALEIAPNTLGAQMSVVARPGGKPWPDKVTVTGQFNGGMTDFNRVIGAHLQDAGWKAIRTLDYWKAQEFFEIGTTPNKYNETTVFTGKPMGPAVSDMFDLLAGWPGTVSGARLTFFLMGGKVNAVPVKHTAFKHRASEWLVDTVLEWDDRHDKAVVDAALQWQRGLQARLKSMLHGLGSYQNFPDPDLKEERFDAYWGTNYLKLKAVKIHRDPGNVFNPPRDQGIL